MSICTHSAYTLDIGGPCKRECSRHQILAVIYGILGNGQPEHIAPCLAIAITYVKGWLCFLSTYNVAPRAIHTIIAHHYLREVLSIVGLHVLSHIGIIQEHRPSIIERPKYRTGGFHRHLWHECTIRQHVINITKGRPWSQMILIITIRFHMHGIGPANTCQISCFIC